MRISDWSSGVCSSDLRSSWIFCGCCLGCRFIQSLLSIERGQFAVDTRIMVRHLLELVDVVAVDPHIVVAQIQRAAASCAIKPPAIVQKCLGRDRARCKLIELLFACDLGLGEA